MSQCLTYTRRGRGRHAKRFVYTSPQKRAKEFFVLKQKLKQSYILKHELGQHELVKASSSWLSSNEYSLIRRSTANSTESKLAVNKASNLTRSSFDTTGFPLKRGLFIMPLSVSTFRR